MNKRILVTLIISIIIISIIFSLYANSDIRFKILQEIGIKNKPKIMDDSYSLNLVSGGIPSPYYISVIGNDIFFNERFTGNLYVITDGYFNKEPILNVSTDNIATKIHGIASYESSIFLHLTEANYEQDVYENNRVLEYNWDGINLKFVQEIEPKILFTDTHHSGGIIVDDKKNIFSTYPIPIDTPLLNYHAYGVHGFTFDMQTNQIWHTTEVDKNQSWIDIVSETNYFPDEFEKIHAVSIDKMENHAFWEIPYYPNSLFIPTTPMLEKFDNSLFVGYCKGDKIKGGIFEYPLNSERTDFLLPDNNLPFREINHENYLIAENFYCVSDIESDSIGVMYISDYTKNGAIYKIEPKS